MDQEEKTSERTSLNVVKLKPEESEGYPQHDIQLMGKRVQLDVDPLIDGYRLQYYHALEVEVPEHIAALTGDKKQKIISRVSSMIIAPKWFDPLLRITLEDRLVSGVAKMKRNLLKVQANYELLGKVLKQ